MSTGSSTQRRPEGAHLVGSVPLRDSETVFRTVGGLLGRHLLRCPDGETGVRTNWIAWQYSVLANTPGLEPVPVGDRGYLRRQLVQLVAHHARGAGGLGVGGDTGVAPRFGSLGYADAALGSFAIFYRLQRAGVIPEQVRFQVSLPTPLAPISVFVRAEDREIVEPAYEQALLAELARITDGIPHDRLAVQWDVSAEFGHLEGIWPTHFDDVEAGILARLRRLGAAVPRDVSLGFHLCYGDFGHKHFVEPADASRLVHVANALAWLERGIDWVHLPVPIGWRDPAPYAPLEGLALQDRTRLYLGVLHQHDGVEGAARRIALAAERVPSFGVATECGLGRRPAETVAPLLALHAELAAPVR